MIAAGLLLLALPALAQEQRMTQGPVPEPVRVADPMAYTLEQLKDSEKRFNVKCFTTFGSAEEALARQALGTGAIEKRAALVGTLADAMYARMRDMSAVTGDRALSPALVRQIFNNTVYAGLTHDEKEGKWTVYLSSGAPIELLDNELFVEKKLSEGWRAVIAMLQRRDQEELARTPFSKESLDALHDLIAMYDLVLLRAAGSLSRARGAHEVAPEDLAEADALLHSDLTGYVAQIHTGRARLTDDALARYNSILFAEAKAYDVEAFNGRVDDEARRKHYEGLAGYPLAADGLKALVDKALPSIGALVWGRAQALMSRDQLYIGAEPMSQAVARSFPSTVDQEENVEFFPNGGSPIRVYSFESDSFRDEPYFWLIVAKLGREALKPRREAAPGELWAGVDPYAADELAEVLSNLGVPALKKAAALAQAAGRKEIRAEDAVAAGKYFEERAAAVRPEELVAPAPPKQSGEKLALKGPFFQDITAASGISADTATIDWSKSTVLDKDFKGMAVLDYDGDGLPDIFLCGVSNRLFKNLGGFKFKDVTAEAGGFGRDCRGVSTADYDGDGRPDLLILGTGRDHRGLSLYHNDGGGKFSDVSAKALPALGPIMPVSAAWLDYDHSGRLAVYIVSHGLKEEGVYPTLGNAKNALPNRLLRNNGDGTFTDVTSTAGVGDTGWGLAVQAFDYDGDGWTDLYVGNDFGRSILYRNQGDGTFKDVSLEAGVDSFGHAMGVSVADVAHDGTPAIFVTNIGMYNPGTRYIRPDARTPIQYTPPLEKGVRIHEANRLYLSAGSGKFREAYGELFEPAPTGWGWSGMFFDFDNDGEQDLYLVNGLNPTSLFYNNSERKVLFHWDRKAGKFVDVSAVSGADFPGIAEGCAFADLGGRGRLDLVAIGRMGVHVFKNVTPSVGHWLEVRLVGKASNRDGYGARVTVKAGDWTRFAEAGAGGGGFVATSSRVLHFGLGDRRGVDELTVRWPSGKVSTLKGVKAGRLVAVSEPD